MEAVVEPLNDKAKVPPVAAEPKVKVWTSLLAPRLERLLRAPAILVPSVPMTDGSNRSRGGGRR